MLILIGFPRSGKTSAGKIAANYLRLPFIDTDEITCQLYQAKHQAPLSRREIALQHGMPFFYALEEEAIASFDFPRQGIISTGGGTPCNLRNLNTLLQDDKKATFSERHFVYLMLDREPLAKRLLTPPLPPYLEGKNPNQIFSKFYRERHPLYHQTARYLIDADCPLPQLADEISTLWQAIHLAKS